MNLIALFRPTRFARLFIPALLVAVATAQETAPHPDAQPAHERAVRGPDGPPRISLDFPGGPLSKLAAKLNADGDPKLSIVQSPGLDPTLPAFSVRDVQVGAVIAALGHILEAQGYALQPVSDNLAVLSRMENRPTSFVSLQLARKLDPQFGWTPDEIIAAIQMGTEFANPEGKSSTLRFKYHPATKLLFVAGTPQEVDVAQRVFGSLTDASPNKTSAPPDKK